MLSGSTPPERKSARYDEVYTLAGSTALVLLGRKTGVATCLGVPGGAAILVESCKTPRSILEYEVCLD